MSTNLSTKKNRTLHLDGIRGVAALSVALFHFFRSFDNSLISGNHFINQTFISALWNGHFAVSLFFVLSGYLFFDKFKSESFFNGAKASAKRFLRLSIPILSICLLAYVVHKTGFFGNQAAAKLSGSDWLARWYVFEPSLSLAIFESLWFDYVSFNPNRTYNSNLWTISYELFAVIGVIFIAIITKNINNFIRIAILICLAAASYGTHYFEFIIGAVLAIVVSERKSSTSLRASIIILVFALSLSALFLPNAISGFASDFFYPVGAALLIISVSTNRALRLAFSNSFFLKLGEISFGLYLTHFLTLNSVASSVYIATESVPITFICYAASTIALSICFTYIVDEPWTNTLNLLFRKKKQAMNQDLNIKV